MWTAAVPLRPAGVSKVRHTPRSLRRFAPRRRLLDFRFLLSRSRGWNRPFKRRRRGLKHHDPEARALEQERLSAPLLRHNIHQDGRVRGRRAGVGVFILYRRITEPPRSEKRLPERPFSALPSKTRSEQEHQGKKKQSDKRWQRVPPLLLLPWLPLNLLDGRIHQTHGPLGQH